MSAPGTNVPGWHPIRLFYWLYQGSIAGHAPTVTVESAYSKHRHHDTLPMRSSTAAMLAQPCVGQDGLATNASVFARPVRSNVVKMLRADLANAEIPYRDDSGRLCDFHALRHTFDTNRARGGVHPRVAQQLARHSTITLTMDRCAHTAVGELANGSDGPPGLSR